MKLYYWREHLNFGDALNAWLWPQLLGHLLDDDERTLFVGIGTLLDHKIPPAPLKAVFGTGAGYGAHPRIDDRWTFYCVRGPLTAQLLGLDPQTAVTDGAALLRLLGLPDEPKQHAAGFMPHWESVDYWDWRAVCAAAGVYYIDPLGPTEQVLRDIRRCEVVIAEAMHGAIVADALRVPWIPVRFYEQILPFKWQDWCASLGMRYEPVHLPPLYNEYVFRTRLPKRLRTRLFLERYAGNRLVDGTLDAIGAGVGRVSKGIYDRKAARLAETLGGIAAGKPWMLSSDRAIDAATERLAHELERFRSDVAAGRFSVSGTQPVLEAANSELSIEGTR